MGPLYFGDNLDILRRYIPAMATFVLQRREAWKK
jgi:hypothetical protein